MVPSLSLFKGRWHWPAAVPATLLAALFSAHAQQPAGPPARPDPLDPQARVPALSYESSFAAYRRLDLAKLVAWRDANDNVARIGGWRVYLREAQQPEPAVAPVAPVAPTIDKRGGHSGYTGHKTP